MIKFFQIVLLALMIVGLGYGYSLLSTLHGEYTNFAFVTVEILLVNTLCRRIVTLNTFKVDGSIDFGELIKTFLNKK